MSSLLILLFLLGLVLSLSGGIIGIVQSFQESVTWGLLYLFVPFASLIFVIKFWSRKWVRNSLFLSLGGVLMFVIGTLMSSMVIQQAYNDFNLEGGDWEESTWEENAWAEDGFEDTGDEGEAVTKEDAGTEEDTGDEVSELSTAETAETATNLQPAFDLAMKAEALTQMAISFDDWSLIASFWQQSIVILESIPEGDPNYSMAQAKIAEYKGHLTYAQQKSVPQ